MSLAKIWRSLFLGSNLIPLGQKMVKKENLKILLYITSLDRRFYVDSEKEYNLGLEMNFSLDFGSILMVSKVVNFISLNLS